MFYDIFRLTFFAELLGNTSPLRHMTIPKPKVSGLQRSTLECTFTGYQI